MKQIIIIIILSILFGYNANKEAPKKSLEETPFIDSADYKYFELTEFDMRGWYYGRIEQELKLLPKEKSNLYFQHDTIDPNYINYIEYRYFSIQKNTDDEKILSMIKIDENCCYNLHLLTFDKHNKLISDNIVAGFGGDGMWGYNQYGQFEDDSTYFSIRINEDGIEYEKHTNYHIDSVVTRYRFYKNKPMEILSKQSFSRDTTIMDAF